MNKLRNSFIQKALSLGGITRQELEKLTTSSLVDYIKIVQLEEYKKASKKTRRETKRK